MTIDKSKDRGGIFAGDDPFVLLQDWLAEASKSEPNDPNAAALATVDAQGLPNVRIVLVKEIEANALVVYTNYESAKGQELQGQKLAALNFHWKTLRRQVRVRATVVREDGPQADAYYASRPLGSRIGAWASEQSRPLPERGVLEMAVRKATETHGDAPVRPPFWGGFRLTPLEMEFWADGASRLHDRFQWKREHASAQWDVSRLNP